MLKRHNLLFLNSNKNIETDDLLMEIGKEKQDILSHLKSEAFGITIPGIVKRQQNVKETQKIEVGFSTHLYHDGSRIRINGNVLESDIDKVVTPFDISDEIMKNSRTEPFYKKEKQLKEIIQVGNKMGFSIGVFGSLALQWITGLTYCNENSDLDLYIQKKDQEAEVEKFSIFLSEIEKQEKMHIDAELEYQNKFGECYGIKLKEYVSKQHTVIAKGLYTIEVFMKEYIN